MKATVKLQEAAKSVPQEPDGYDGLQEQLKSAKRALVFGPEDRAPHGLFFACGRLYQASLHHRVTAAGAFATETRSSKEVLQEIAAFNEAIGATHRPRLPYLYGCWKAKKKAFCWTAGTSRVQDGEEVKAEPEDSGPPQECPK